LDILYCYATQQAEISGGHTARNFKPRKFSKREQAHNRLQNDQNSTSNSHFLEVPVDKQVEAESRTSVRKQRIAETAELNRTAMTLAVAL
jgi:hypothetical protein